MNEPKLILFGSFSEDELKTWQKKPESAKPAEKREFQFGSLTFVSEPSSGPVIAQCSKGIDTEVNPSVVEKKDESLKNSTASNQLHFGSKVDPKNNGFMHGSSHLNCTSSGAKQAQVNNLPLASLHVSQHEEGPMKETKMNFQVIGSTNSNGKSIYSTNEESNLNSQRLVPPEDEIKKAPNGIIDAVSCLLPRGLINLGNLCFLNATLQALLACSPFVYLLQDLRSKNISEASYPTLKAFADFISEFDMPNGASSVKKDASAIETGRAFSPAMFEVVLQNFTPDVPSGMFSRPRQEDAQEFLSFVMDQMHDELLKLHGHVVSTSGVKSSLISSSEDEEWETVGPKNKSAVTRTQSFVPSELSDIFGGQLRSVVKARGNKASATVQPYLLLHLNIFPESVHTIEDALRLFPAPETLEGYRTSATGKGAVSASKSVKILTLSKILILHLMRFSYGSQGSTKLHKTVHFPLEFVLGSQLLVSPTTESRKYELVATITHHGRDPSKGHYTADVRYPNSRWLHFDDASVTHVPTSKVLQEQAYVLFYKKV